MDKSQSNLQQTRLEILGNFPRVSVFDHSKMNSLGGSLRDLILKVKSEKFAYLHSDVYLPRGFGLDFSGLNLKNKWLETPRNLMIVHEEPGVAYRTAQRSYSGAQFGDSNLLKRAVASVQDDYLYRNEDIVISERVMALGGDFIKTNTTPHVHQVVSKNSENEPKLIVDIQRSRDDDYEIDTHIKQFRAIVKYVSPRSGTSNNYLVADVNLSLQILHNLDALNWAETISWVSKTNPEWLKYLKKPSKEQTLLRRTKNLFNSLRRI